MIATLGSPIVLASGEISHEYAIPFNALIGLTEAEDNFLQFFSYHIYLTLL